LVLSLWFILPSYAICGENSEKKLGVVSAGASGSVNLLTSRLWFGPLSTDAFFENLTPEGALDGTLPEAVCKLRRGYIFGIEKDETKVTRSCIR
jgi:hypothetical protein